MACKGNRNKRMLALYFFRRLRRLILLKQKYREKLNERGLSLLNKAIFSTYLDLKNLWHGKTVLWYIRHFREKNAKAESNK